MAGYPPQQQYPPQQGYPPQQQQQQGYPPPTQNYPGYPPAQPNYPAQQQGGYAPPQGYPPQQQAGYPPQQPGYPPQQQQGYPPQQQQGGYPPAQQGNYTYQNAPPPQHGQGQPGYPGHQPQQQQAYPPQQQQQGYPPQQQQQGYPPQQQYQQGHAPQHGQPQQLFYSPGGPPMGPAEIDRDCQALRKAMKGMGTDEKALIEVLCKRTPEQAEQIYVGYKSHFGRDLYKDVESETSGNFKKLMTLLTLPLREVDAICLKEAMAGVGTNEDALIEILVGRTNAELNAIRQCYKLRFNKNLEEVVASETSGHLKKVLVALLQANRDENGAGWNVDADVEALYRAGVGKMGTDEATFISILCSRPDYHLRNVFNAYRLKYNQTMEQVVKKEFSGDIEKALLSIVRSSESRATNIAYLFEKSMAGMGTKDNKLIRLTVRHRDPRIMMQVKQAYQQLYGKPLYQRVEGETSGDYKKALLACVGP
ncbi:Annexin A11 [Phlyctochytrium arcticum]|nr:Annexin A11 [Phlyctochytrium arcticum]